MMTKEDRELALQQMNNVVDVFYHSATRIGNHPFIEFAGIMQAYIKSCERAHAQGIDFSECNRHAGNPLPMESYEVDYLNEKLNCIFDGRILAHDL
jgi:hypothetical protein